MTLPQSSDGPDHWHRLALESLEAEYVREEDQVAFELRRLEISFAPTTVGLAAHLESIVVDPDLMGSLQELKFLSGRWGGDWNLICSRFGVTGVILPSLSLVSFVGSLTPTPSLGITLACSPSCYHNLQTTHPSDVFVADLLGGYEVIVRTLSSVNLGRLDVLGGYIPVGSRAHLVAHGRGGDVVLEQWGRREVDGWQRGDGNEGWSALDGGGVSRSLCFGCGETKIDPVLALMECGREEVRDALLEVGFDILSFDARPFVSSDTHDALSFETFLRL